MGALLAGLTSEGLGAVLALVTLIHWRKNGSPKSVSWMALFTGILLAAPILALMGGLTGLAILGAPVLLLLTVGTGFLFYHEGIKERKPHYWRTPLVALLFGVCLASAGGVVGNLVHTATTTGIHVVTKVGSSTGG
jgi:hypothetical protein